MHQPPTHNPAPQLDLGLTPAGDLQRSLAILMRTRDTTRPATNTAQTRQRNAHRAAYAAGALQHHAQVSTATTTAGTATEAGAGQAKDTIEQALVELLTDIHHLCDTCDLELATLLQAAALIHTHETRPR